MSTFTENDLRLLDKTLQIREQLVDNLLKESLPKSSKEIDSFTNLLESIDRSVLGKAKIKIEDSTSKANEETKELLRSLLVDLHKNATPTVNLSLQVNEVPEYKPSNINISDGELICKVDNLDVESIIESHKL